MLEAGEPDSLDEDLMQGSSRAGPQSPPASSTSEESDSDEFDSDGELVDDNDDDDDDDDGLEVIPPNVFFEQSLQARERTFSPARSEQSVSRTIQARSPPRRKMQSKVSATATLGAGNEPWERRQAHRRLREMMSCFRGGKVSAELGPSKSFGTGPDRGRLVRESNALRALEAGQCGSRVGRLPPLDSSKPSETARRVVSVSRDTLTGEVQVREKAPASRPSCRMGLMMSEMGYAPRAEDPPASASLEEANVSSTKEQLKQRKMSRLRKAFLERHRDKWAAEEDATEIVEAKAEDIRRLTMQELYPHISVEEFPPRLLLKGEDFQNPAHIKEYPAVKRGKQLQEKLDQLDHLLHPEEYSSMLKHDHDGEIPDDATSRKILEDPVKLVKQLDDRLWGLAATSSESINKLRQRLPNAGANTSPVKVADADLCFASIDRLLEISADASLSFSSKKENTRVEEISSDLLVQQASLHISQVRSMEEVHLYVLCVGVAGTNPVGLPYSEAERNARWMAETFRAVGACVEVLLGCDATRDGIRLALSSLLSQARASEATEPKVIVYFSGRGRVNEDDELTFVPVDAIELMAGPAVHLNPRVVNLHELSQRQVLDRFQDDTAAAATGAGQDAGRKPFSQRWSFPVVIGELLIERAESAGKPPKEVVAEAERMDFWRSEYVGVVLAPQHVGGNLSARCSFRHHSLVSYYFSKCFDGRLTGFSQHIGTLPQIVQFIATKLRKRNIPTLVLRCPPMPGDSLSRASEEIIHASQTFFPSAAAKAAMKASRLNRKCRFQIICEVDARYRSNATAFVTRLVARYREVMNHNKAKTKKSAAPEPIGISLWLGTRRMEHRVYLPLAMPLSMDQTRYEMLQTINRSSLTSTRTGALASARALETLENVRLELAKLDHCVVIYSAGQLQNRWGKIPATKVQEVDASMSFRPKEELENDFVTFIATSAYVARDYNALEFLFEKVFTDLVTVQGMGSHNDLRRLAKMLRFGLLDTIGTCSCRIERLEVTSFGAQEAETQAAIFVQRMVRRYLTGRVMRSRLSAAMTFVRSHSDALAKAYATYSDEVVVLFFEYQEATFSALEREATRCRWEVACDEGQSFLAICKSCVTSWVELETRRRRILLTDYTAETLALSKISSILPIFASTSLRCSQISTVEHLIRTEKLQRQRTVVSEYGERCDMKSAMKKGAEEIRARQSPVVIKRAPVRAKKIPMTLDQLSHMV
jgi:hypothetical protein